VTLEAIASGLAVITTDTGAAELVDTNGFIIKKHDYTDISEKISILMKNPEILSNLKKRSVEKAEKISWKNCADSYLEIYRSVIDWRNLDDKLEKTNHLCCTPYERQ
jgi:glycosyltransferase involved in cell wall biosynthesis